MEQTAMQKLLTQFKENNKSGWFSFDEIEQTILDFGLKLEKEQILNSFNQGYRVGFNDGNSWSENNKDISEYDDAMNYYKETFEIE